MKAGSSTNWDRLASMLRQHVGCAGGDGFSSALESCLVPIVRLALVRKIGPEPVVQWVQEQIEKYPATQDIRNTTRSLARALGEQLRDRRDPLQGRETVVGM